MKKFPSISVCMIVKDEEENLPRLFESVRGLADEVILVDTGSKDKTVEIARGFGAKVYHFAWCDDFSAARNESLKHATKDFLFWLDGDDELRKSEHDTIRAHLRRYPGAGAYLRTQVESEGQALQLRILPNHRGIRFEGRVHEQAIGSLERQGIPIYICDASIIHHGYEAPGALPEKLRRNLSILKEDLAERPWDMNVPFFLARTYLGLGDHESALTHLDAIIDRGQEDQTVRKQAGFSLAFVDKGTILGCLGRFDEALATLASGRTFLPQNVLIPFLSGKIHFEKQEYREAYDDLLPLKDETFERETTPINVNEMRNWLCRALGVSALFADDLVVAEVCFLRGIERDPTDKSAYHHLALTRERKGDIDGAVAACRLGVEQDPGDGYIRKRLFLLLLKRQDFAEALECYGTLNGGSMDLDALTGRFLLSCRALEAPGIQLYYRYLQEKLSMEPLDFPQNLQATKDGLRALNDARPVELFDAAVSFLLQQS